MTLVARRILDHPRRVGATARPAQTDIETSASDTHRCGDPQTKRPKITSKSSSSSPRKWTVWKSIPATTCGHLTGTQTSRSLRSYAGSDFTKAR